MWVLWDFVLIHQRSFSLPHCCSLIWEYARLSSLIHCLYIILFLTSFYKELNWHAKRSLNYKTIYAKNSRETLLLIVLLFFTYYHSLMANCFLKTHTHTHLGSSSVKWVRETGGSVPKTLLWTNIFKISESFSLDDQSTCL